MWSGQSETPIGAIVSAANLWALSQHWYDGRLLLDWKSRSKESSQELLTASGFVGKFWSLSG